MSVLVARPRTAPGHARHQDVERVEAIIAAGRHGELNRRLRAQLDRAVAHIVVLAPARVIDADHPAPGVLLPRRRVTEYRRRTIRFLAGAHDVEAFVKVAGQDAMEVVRALHAEINGGDDATASRA